MRNRKPKVALPFFHKVPPGRVDYLNALRDTLNLLSFCLPRAIEYTRLHPGTVGEDVDFWMEVTCFERKTDLLLEDGPEGLDLKKVAAKLLEWGAIVDERLNQPAGVIDMIGE